MRYKIIDPTEGDADRGYWRLVAQNRDGELVADIQLAPDLFGFDDLNSAGRLYERIGQALQKLDDVEP